MSRYRASDMRVESLNEEHGFLRAWMVSLRQEFLAPETTAGQALAWVTRLRAALVDHFNQEESGGYFAELIAVAPRLSTRAETLEREHVLLLASLDEIQADLRQASPLAPPLASVVERFTTLAGAFLAHEAAENDLVQSAFEDELGTAD